MDKGERLNLAILGATGSIGTSTLDVVTRHRDRYRVFALSAQGSADALLALCRVHQPRYAVLAGARPEAKRVAEFRRHGTELLFGAQALEQVATDSRCDVVMAAIVGAAGLASTLAAARAGKRVLLANKEALVMAGPLLMRAAREGAATIVPVDSEHNAVFQCLSDAKAVRRIVLTASGGPFRAAPLESLDAVTPAEACAHPTWVMGRKISVDSATMMNKGLEVIEAHWLFDLPAEQIDVVIHPQSIVHSLVEYIDGSVLAQLGIPDMSIPISYILAHPERLSLDHLPSLDLVRAGRLEFFAPDVEQFPCLGLAYDALRRKGTAPAVLNGANEVLVDAFLNGRIGYTDIPRIAGSVLERHPFVAAPSLEQLLAADAWARQAAAADPSEEVRAASA